MCDGRRTQRTNEHYNGSSRTCHKRKWTTKTTSRNFEIGCSKITTKGNSLFRFKPSWWCLIHSIAYAYDSLCRLRYFKLSKDVYGIVHIPPCSLLYPNYDFSKHFDMMMVMKRIDKLCYFNVAQFRQAVSNVVKCQTDFFPSNTVRHEFAFKFEQFSRKLTTYRSLLVSHPPSGKFL